MLLRQSRTGAADIFGTDALLEPANERCSPDDVDVIWRRYLAAGARRFGTAAFADILDDTSWLAGELQSSLVRLVKAGVVHDLDADASKRRSKPLHFDKVERLQLTQS